MNKTSALLLFFSLSIVTFAQVREKKWNLSASGGISVYAGDLGSGITDFNSEVFNQNIIVGVSISRYLNASFDVTLQGIGGSWGYYDKAGGTIFKGDMLHGNLNVRYKLSNGYLLKEDSRLSPYLFAGVGYTNYSGSRITDGVDYPIVGGLGLRFRMTDALYLNYTSTYGYMSTAYNNPTTTTTKPTGTDEFMFHTIGLGFNFGRMQDEDKDGVSDTKDKCPSTPTNAKVDATGCPVDKDGDGVADYLDNCPSVAGKSSTNGCPDSDNDGIADGDDKCPTVAGVVALNGCPDADGDGITDNIDKCPNVKGTAALDGCPDRDGDGVKDEDDLCPDVKGAIAFKGCPDTDNDGIEDSKDMCPTVKGPISTNGCPDTDNDGVNDGIDKCPTVAGSPAHSGCPDTDNDGIYDDIDKCVTVPGTAANKGCPEVKKEVMQLFQKALQGIQFETGKAIIKPVSFPILDAIVKVMKQNPTYKLSIGGHTDNVGDDAMNQTLSQDRASSVANYLITKGVDPLRVNATGYGENKPVDTNDSVKGRTRNRRVEFSVEFLETVK